MSLIAIPANDIDISGRALDVSLPASWLQSELADADVSAPAPGHLKVRLSRSGVADIVVRGRVQATVSTPCARCLGPAEVPVDTELSLLLQPAPTPRPHARPGANGQQTSAARKPGGDKDKEPEYEFSSEEADVDTYDGETVVLDGFVREAILLEMPSFPLCSEACPGIRPAAPDGAVEAEPPPAPEANGVTGEERHASLADLRDRFAQRSGRVPRAAEPTLKNDTPSKKTKKE